MFDSFVTPWTVAHQALLSIGFSRQEHWSGMLFPSHGIFPALGVSLRLLRLLHWQAGAVPKEPPGKTKSICWWYPKIPDRAVVFL